MRSQRAGSSVITFPPRIELGAAGPTVVGPAAGDRYRMPVPQRRQSLIEEGAGDGVRAARRAADPSSDRIAATRARLLSAAEALFLDQGYDDVSVRMINAKAGLNPGAVHYHFGSKRGLVVALLEDRLLRNWESGGGRRFDAIERRPR